MRIDARFFDGEIARDHAVAAEIMADGIAIEGPSLAPRKWSFAGLSAITPLESGQPLRLAHDSAPGARLVVKQEGFIGELVRRAPQIAGGVNIKKAARLSAIVALCALLATAVLYLILSYAPQTLAFVLPEAWRNTLGDQVEQTVASYARLCATSNDNTPLGDLRNRLVEGNPNSPAFSLKVYDLKIINAFTLPGGRIVLTRDLIDAAKTPEELAGVVAHEVGHVYHRHPEAQLVRSMGIELLLRIASGGGDTISGFAGLLAILRYSRDAEREADAYALHALANAAIDPIGLKRFFEAMQKLEGGRSKPGGGLFGAMNDILSTHPVTAERIDDIKPLPAGTVTRPALSAVEWASLKKVCG